MTLLKPTEMAELKKLAGADLDAALLAAVRLGATRPAEPINLAAELLESDAKRFKGYASKASDLSKIVFLQASAERKRVAKALRDLLTNEEGKEGSKWNVYGLSFIGSTSRWHSSAFRARRSIGWSMPVTWSW